jgi:sugar phosphate isomerase/epimerase
MSAPSRRPEATTAMHLEIGIKSDPIEYRYTFEWLFRLMKRRGVTLLQLGSFHELYRVDDVYLHGLRSLAARYGVRIKSCFTAHRELGGFFAANKHLERVARESYERLIHVAAVLGADYAGGSAGFVYRDAPGLRARGMDCYLSHMRELMELARAKGLRGLTMEVMSSTHEPPSTPEEIDAMTAALSSHHAARPSSTVPVYLCGDTSHGVADADRRVAHSNVELFERAIPHMCEFHIKNTDAIFNATFGFSPTERERGIVDLASLRDLVARNAERFPVADLVGYLEHPGPKIGRDYTDNLLAGMLEESLDAIQAVFGDGSPAGEAPRRPTGR